ncbi:FAD-dependent oxidoreductase, partial [Mycolicibacterium elephantis]
GLDVTWVDEADVPFPFAGGVRLPEQAQFDPMPLLDSLIVELDERGGRLAQGVRVQKVSSKPDGLALSVRTNDGAEFDMHATQCVLATGIPILDRGGFFARLQPNRSYCMAYRVPGDITRGMYISADSPTRSIRYAPTAEGDRLLVGGAGHPVGHRKSPASSVQELDAWAKLHYPGAMQTNYWSAQDYTPIDELPYVGPILPGNDK